MNNSELQEILNNIQENCIFRRSELELTQEQLANRMQISRQNIVLIENNLKGITLNRLAKLAKALDCKIMDLIK